MDEYDKGAAGRFTTPSRCDAYRETNGATTVRDGFGVGCSDDGL
jgi:hypothetical protein